MSVDEAQPLERRAESTSAVYVGTSVDAMRDTTKWLVSGAAAIAALLLAGLQVTSISDVDSVRTFVAFVVALGAVALGLFGAWRTIRSGAKVLAGSAVSFAGIVTQELETKLRAKQKHDPFAEPFERHSLLGELHWQRKVLYRETTAESPSALLSLLNDAYAGLRAVEAGKSTTIDGRSYGISEVDQLRALVATLEARVREVQEAAAIFETTQGYRSFVSQLPWSAAMLVVAVGAFASTRRRA